MENPARYPDRPATADDLNAERLRQVTSQMVDALTSPAYVEAMRAVKSAPEGQRLEEAMRRLTPDALKAQGVPLPAGMRISSRYFEQGSNPLELELSDGRNLGAFKRTALKFCGTLAPFV